MDSLFDLHPLGDKPEELERRIRKLQKINAALMQRVERSMDAQANAYSLFQTAITLEGQVRLRTEEVTNALARLERTNDELSTARDASERANRFKTRFFTAVGHDLLQPLHAARLSASALVEPNGSEHQRRIAERIEHALTTIEELLKSILDISKLEAGAVTPAMRPVALDDHFASIVLDIEPQARAKGLSLTWRHTGLSVVSDPLMLRRILQNLLVNAVQYTEKGGIRLLARRRGENVRIEVWDTGPGIGEADREMIFEEFQRGSATDRPAIGGFGLGLSIVQRMAEALGHPLDLCSRLGHGTRFSLTAPRADSGGSGTNRNGAHGTQFQRLGAHDGFGRRHRQRRGRPRCDAGAARTLGLRGSLRAQSRRPRRAQRRRQLPPRSHPRRLPPRLREQRS